MQCCHNSESVYLDDDTVIIQPGATEWAVSGGTTLDSGQQTVITWTNNHKKSSKFSLVCWNVMLTAATQSKAASSNDSGCAAAAVTVSPSWDNEDRFWSGRVSDPLTDDQSSIQHFGPSNWESFGPIVMAFGIRGNHYAH